MTGKNKKKKGLMAGNIAAQNRRARHDYEIEERFETGIMLIGSEVKSLRQGQGSIAEAYAEPRGGELWLVNAHIPEYHGARFFGHEPKRPRKLLLRRREIEKLTGAVQRAGMTLVPLTIYFNDRGLAKVELALARGRRKVDKREAVKDRDWQRQKHRLLKEH